MAVSNDDLLQSNGWEKFQRALGRITHRVDSVLAVEMPLSFGLRYMYSPRGIINSRQLAPTFRASGSTVDGEHDAGFNVHETSAIFWRAEHSSNLAPHGSPSKLQRSGASRLTTPLILRRLVEPEWTWRTSLVGSDDELLGRMHEKHRYNIRLAERRGVVVRMTPPPHAPPPEEGGKEKQLLPVHRRRGVEEKYFPHLPLGGGVRGGGICPRDLDSCWFLLQETAHRQGIATHPKTYYETMLRVLSRQSTVNSQQDGTDCRLYLAEHDGVAIAAAIVAYYGDTATYLHGGSSYAHRALMAPHLLHWQAMRDARAVGMRWYEWGGIEPPPSLGRHSEEPRDEESHTIHVGTWAGITRFKQGFGGEAVHHSPTRDLVFRPKLYRILSWLVRARG
ncbi:MAG: peptidoglycan bridge formation glycyltransferase FemA/FemB family protein [Candidatus Uhrbacteria bacterium]